MLFEILKEQKERAYFKWGKFTKLTRDYSKQAMPSHVPDIL